MTGIGNTGMTKHWNDYNEADDSLLEGTFLDLALHQMNQ